MASYPRNATGRARVSSRRPEAFAVCDRCGVWINHVNLTWQHEWAGPRLQNLRLLVCSRCLDDPNEQLRVYAVPADPLPIRNPRPELSKGIQPSYVQDTPQGDNITSSNDGSPIEVEP